MAEQDANTSPGDSNPKLDRREYFRIDDQMILRYRSVPPEAVGHMPPERHFDNSEMFALLRELRQIDQEHNNVLRVLAEQNRELGIYLKSLNRKIELVGKALSTLDEGQQHVAPQHVSISEASLAFRIGTSLSPGNFVALELVLLPSHTGLALYGEVIETRDSNGLTVVAFVRLRESDRQILARHILQVQIAAKKKQDQADDLELE